jgi:hypothetical protein
VVSHPSSLHQAFGRRLLRQPLHPALKSTLVARRQPTRPSDPAWIARQRSRERQKLLGMLLVAVIILVLAFLRFGKTIPWGAR